MIKSFCFRPLIFHKNKKNFFSNNLISKLDKFIIPSKSVQKTLGFNVNSLNPLIICLFYISNFSFINFNQFITTNF